MTISESTIFSFIIIKKSSTSSYGGLDSTKQNLPQSCQISGLLVKIPERYKPKERPFFTLVFHLEQWPIQKSSTEIVGI